jgi:hypothetical protein
VPQSHEKLRLKRKPNFTKLVAAVGSLSCNFKEEEATTPSRNKNLRLLDEKATTLSNATHSYTVQKIWMADEQQQEPRDPQRTITKITCTKRFAVIKTFSDHAAFEDWNNTSRINNLAYRLCVSPQNGGPKRIRIDTSQLPGMTSSTTFS